MSTLYDAGQALGRHLVVEQGYVPLEQLLPAAEGLARSLDGALAVFEGPDLRVHAWLLDEDAPQPQLQAEGLRVGLEALEEKIPGRVKATVWLICADAARRRELRKSYLDYEDGHFLSKVLVGRGLLSVEDAGGEARGRLAPLPRAEALAAFLDPARAPDESVSRRRLALRQADERQARRLLKGSATPMTWVIIGANALVFGAQYALAHQLSGQGFDEARAWNVALQIMGANEGGLTLGQGQYWRLLAACFLHAGYLHILLNMMSLFSLGAITERLCGPWRFLGFYLLCGLGASALSAWLGQGGISVGASGAILGLAGALMAPHWRRDPRLPKELSDRLFSWLARPIGLLFAVGFGLQLLDLPFQLDNFAHLGGLLTGFAVAYIYPPFLIRKTDRKV